MSGTAREALIAELLGDIGKLHDEIKSLPANFHDVISPSLKEISLASKEAREALIKQTEIQKIDIYQFTSSEKLTFREEMKKAIRDEASEIINSAFKTLHASAQAHENSTKEVKKRTFIMIFLSVFLTLFTSASGITAGWFFFGKEQEKQAEFGRALLSIWHDLDEKTKEKIRTSHIGTPH